MTPDWLGEWKHTWKECQGCGFAMLEQEPGKLCAACVRELRARHYSEAVGVRNRAPAQYPPLREVGE